jgi:hypothetical protein
MDTNLVDIVRSIIDRIDRNIRIKEIVGNRAYVCSTLWVTIGKIIQDENGYEWKVIDFEFDEWLELEPVGHSETLSGSILVANAILFLHGSPSSTNNEYLLIKSRTMKKTPFIWLLVSYEYDNLPADSSIVASYNARLFFMDWANTPKWRNDQHNEIVIKPMENLSKAFIDVVEDDYTFKRLNAYTRRPRPRFGVEVTDKGSDKTIIHENLSGIDLSVTLELFDISTCCK